MASRFVRNSIFGVLAGVSTTLGNFISGLLLARFLGVELTGEIAFIIWLINTLVTVFVAGIPSTLSRYLPELTGAADPAIATGLQSYLFRPFLISVCIPVICLIIYAAWLGYSENPGASLARSADTLREPVIYAIIAACCGTQAIADYVKAYYRGIQKFDLLARITIVAVTLQLVLIAAGGLVFGASGVLIGYLVGNGLPAIYIRLAIQGNRKVDPELRGRVVKYARFRWASEVLAAFVWSRIEVFFLLMWWGSGPVGYLTVGLTLANLAVQGPLMLTWGLLPKFTERFGNREFDQIRDDYQTTTRLIAILIFPACLGLAAIIPELLPLLFGQAFEPATTAAIILVSAAAIPAVSTVGSNIIWGMNRSDLEFYSGIMGGVVAILCGLTIIPAFGVVGAAVARMLTQFSAVGLVTWLMASKLEVRAPVQDLLRIFVSATICAFVARLALWLVPTSIVGVPLAILAGGVTYFIALRVFKAFPSSDADKIKVIISKFPLHVSRPVQFALKLVLR